MGRRSKPEIRSAIIPEAVTTRNSKPKPGGPRRKGEVHGVRRRGRCLVGYPALRATAWAPRWSSSAARAHAVVVSVLTPAEILIAARRLAEARPHLAATGPRDARCQRRQPGAVVLPRGPVAAVPR